VHNEDYIKKIIYSTKGRTFDNTTFSSKFDEVISTGIKLTNFNAVVNKGQPYDK